MGVWSNKNEDQSVGNMNSSGSFPKKRSYIGQTIFVNGELDSEEEILIEGRIKGIVRSKGLVIVGKSGIVDAEMELKR